MAGGFRLITFFVSAEGVTFVSTAVRLWRCGTLGYLWPFGLKLRNILTLLELCDTSVANTIFFIALKIVSIFPYPK